MGFDTRYWGPSGWQLFHLIAFRSDHSKKLLSMIKDILPCRFCRESTTAFMKEIPLKDDTGKWLYELHNRVNHKLRTQCKDDPTVVNPGPDPSFEQVKDRYMNMKPINVPGRNFLFTISANYPATPEQHQIELHSEFLKHLSEVYPFQQLRKSFQEYYNKNPPALENHKSYMKWMYGLLLSLSKTIKVHIPTYKGYVQHVMYYKSECEKKKYRGKTCRKMAGGGYEKQRDHLATKKRAHLHLL